MSENLKIAENINTPAAQLKELANNTKDLPLLIAIAKNPNTPPDLLIELAVYKDCFDALGSNPALDLILLEHPNFIEDIWYKNILTEYKICSSALSSYIYNSEYFPLPIFF